jgi:hypothetical protein
MLVILSGASRSFIVRGVVEEPAVRDLNLCNELQRHHTSAKRPTANREPLRLEVESGRLPAPVLFGLRLMLFPSCRSRTRLWCGPRLCSGPRLRRWTRLWSGTRLRCRTGLRCRAILVGLALLISMRLRALVGRLHRPRLRLIRRICSASPVVVERASLPLRGPTPSRVRSSRQRSGHGHCGWAPVVVIEVGTPVALGSLHMLLLE